MMRAFLNSLWFRLLLGFAVPLVLFLGAALVSFFSIHRLLNSLEREQASQTVVIKISEAREQIEAMAAAKRAHHLLNRREFEQEFYDRRRVFQTDVELLRQSLVDEPEQMARLARI